MLRGVLRVGDPRRALFRHPLVLQRLVLLTVLDRRLLCRHRSTPCVSPSRLCSIDRAVSSVMAAETCGRTPQEALDAASSPTPEVAGMSRRTSARSHPTRVTVLSAFSAASSSAL